MNEDFYYVFQGITDKLPNHDLLILIEDSKVGGDDINRKELHTYGQAYERMIKHTGERFGHCVQYM